MLGKAMPGIEKKNSIIKSEFKLAQTTHKQELVIMIYQ